jgi:glycosyltransferase involved in cell wall biosynthesis
MRADALPDRLRTPAPSVTAVVPARNEADVVRRSVASLAAQQYPGVFQLVLVDDDSRDGTAAIALPGSAPVDVVTARPLPAGWTGKMWAVAEGVRGVESDYLLLTDCRHRAPTRSSGDVSGAGAGRRL